MELKPFLFMTFLILGIAAAVFYTYKLQNKPAVQSAVKQKKIELEEIFSNDKITCDECGLTELPQ